MDRNEVRSFSEKRKRKQEQSDQKRKSNKNSFIPFFLFFVFVPRLVFVSSFCFLLYGRDLVEEKDSIQDVNYGLKWGMLFLSFLLFLGWFSFLWAPCLHFLFRLIEKERNSEKHPELGASVFSLLFGLFLRSFFRFSSVFFSCFPLIYFPLDFLSHFTMAQEQQSIVNFLP